MLLSGRERERNWMSGHPDPAVACGYPSPSPITLFHLLYAWKKNFHDDWTGNSITSCMQLFYLGWCFFPQLTLIIMQLTDTWCNTRGEVRCTMRNKSDNNWLKGYWAKDESCIEISSRGKKGGRVRERENERWKRLSGRSGDDEDVTCEISIFYLWAVVLCNSRPRTGTSPQTADPLS